MLSSFHLLIINGAILTACAVFINAVNINNGQQLILTALMLFLPLLDKGFREFNYRLTSTLLLHWSIAICFIFALILIDSSQLSSLVGIILFTALPEEWFFRRYCQQLLQTFFSTRKKFHKKLPAPWAAIIFTSLFFALIHLPFQGITGLSVFFPSLFLGWVYQLNRDLVLVVLVHALFNLFYMIFFSAATL